MAAGHVELTPHLIAAEPLIEEIREQAREWRDQEMQARRANEDFAAAIAHGKAVVLEQLAIKVELRAIGGGR